VPTRRCARSVRRSAVRCRQVVVMTSLLPSGACRCGYVRLRPRHRARVWPRARRCATLRQPRCALARVWLVQARDWGVVAWCEVGQHAPGRVTHAVTVVSPRSHGPWETRRYPPVVGAAWQAMQVRLIRWGSDPTTPPVPSIWCLSGAVTCPGRCKLHQTNRSRRRRQTPNVFFGQGPQSCHGNWVQP